MFEFSPGCREDFKAPRLHPVVSVKTRHTRAAAFTGTRSIYTPCALYCKAGTRPQTGAHLFKSIKTVDCLLAPKNPPQSKHQTLLYNTHTHTSTNTHTHTYAACQEGPLGSSHCRSQQKTDKAGWICFNSAAERGAGGREKYITIIVGTGGSK